MPDGRSATRGSEKSLALLDNYLDILEVANKHGEVGWHSRKLRRYVELLFESLPVKKGQRVIIAKDLEIDKGSGWWPSREALAVGQTGVAKDVDYNLHYDYWYADVVLDEEWAIYEPMRVDKNDGPRRMDREPDKRHIFSIPVKYLKAIE